MTFDFTNLQNLSEKLNDAIAQLPELEKWELTDTLYAQTDLTLDDLQNLTTALKDTLKPEITG